MAQTQYEIIKELYRFPDVPGREWHKELNLRVRRQRQMCIRDSEKIGKGICLSENEFRELIEVAETLLY